MTQQDWNEYKVLVLKELEANKKFQERVDDRLDKLDVDMAVVKTKVLIAQAGLGTVFAGLIGILIKLVFGG